MTITYVRYRVGPLLRWRARDYFLWPVGFALSIVLARNYALRRKGLAPDQWHWADRLLLRLGWAMRIIETRSTGVVAKVGKRPPMYID